MTGRDLNIVLLPDEKTSKLAINLSEKLTSQIPSYFTLNTTNFKPHITLYQGSFPEKNIPRVLETVEQITKELNPVNISTQGFFISPGGYVWWNTEKGELQGLHEKMLNATNHLREGLIPEPSLEQLPNLAGREKENVLETGAIYNRDLYSPHITITRLKKLEDKEKSLRILEGNKTQISFMTHIIGVANLGAHGTISEIIKEFRLTNNQ